VNAKVKITRLLISLLALLLVAFPARTPAQAGAAGGTIAYVHSHGPNGDEIHLIEPDGSNDRILFQTNNILPENLSDIGGLAWKPDASELAFTSRHEYTCSQYEEDIYAIRPDGQNYRRITKPPACGQRAGLPTGTVTVPVRNYSGDTGPFIVYFEGAPAAKSVMVPYGSTMDVTFTNVADYGSQTQSAVWMFWDIRYVGASTDVIPGAAVRTAPLDIISGVNDWGFRSPSYLPDGSRIAAILSKFQLYTFDPNSPAIGANGQLINFDFDIAGLAMVWAPTPELKDYFLYFGSVTGGQYGVKESILLGNINDTTGVELIDIDPNEDGNYLLGLNWLPDGSGFLYSLKRSYMDMDTYIWYDVANLYVYFFATGESTQLTEVPNNTYTRDMTVSSDGSKILFEYQYSGDWINANPPIDLYMMNLNTGDVSLFVEDARTPVWSLQDIPHNHPVPALAGLNPSTKTTGQGNFTLTVTGSNFESESAIRWNGTALTTTYVNSTTLTAQVTANKIAAPGNASITVFTPAPGGGLSQPMTLRITSSALEHAVFIPFLKR
jgi:hypothetical protein